MLSFGLWIGYEFQTRIRENVIDQTGLFEPEFAALLNFYEPDQISEYLNENIDKNKTIETWARELGILSNHCFHYPDQSILGAAFFTIFREGQQFYPLGEEYFSKVRPDYLIIDWYGRHYQLYNPEFLVRHAIYIKTIGQRDWHYEVYKLNLTGIEEE